MNDDSSHIGTRNLGKLFLTAILSRSKALSFDAKLRLINATPEFDIEDEALLEHYLRPASSQTERKIPLLHCTGVSRKEAARQARAWLARGVFILCADDLVTERVLIPDFPSTLFAWGNQSAAAKPTAAILCSRKSLATVPHSSFLETLKSLVRQNAQAGRTIVSSYGTVGYNAVTALNRGAFTIVVCTGALPFMADENCLEKFLTTHDGFFDPQNTLFVASMFPNTTFPAVKSMLRRDIIVAGLSRTLFGVAVRPGGNMEKIIGHAMQNGVSVQMINTAAPRTMKKKVRLAQNRSGQQFIGTHASSTLGHGVLHSEPGIGQPSQGGDARAEPHTHPNIQPHIPTFLYHYTRSAPGPWLGQSLAEYWDSLLDDDPHCSHTGLDTLWKILSEKRIRASTRLIRRKEPVVCFSEVPPEKLASIMRWRRGLRNWSVEPYGVGIHAAVLAMLGAKPVTYGLTGEYHAMPPHEKYLFQVRESKGYFWAAETEWRLKGDLCFADIPRNQVVVVVASKEDETFMRSQFNYQIICWETLSSHTGNSKTQPRRFPVS